MPPETTLFRKWLPLALLILGLLVIAIDSSVLNVSIGPIVRDLHITLTQVQWVISAYSLVLGAFLITGGRLGDVFGRRKMFVVGAIIFAIGSVFASYSTNFATMLIGESILEGIGAALMSPATTSLLVATYKGRDRSIAYGFWGSAAAIGIAIGPLLGGYFATHSTWRWSFRINLFVVALLLLGSRFLPKDTDFKDHRRFDWWGVVFSALGILAVMFAVIESATYGIIHEKTPLMIWGKTLHLHGYSAMPLVGLAGLLILGLFMLYESYREKRGLPLLVSPHLFQNRQYTAGSVCFAIYAAAQVSLMFTLAIFFQTVAGLDSLRTGYIYFPPGSFTPRGRAACWLAGTKISPRHLIQTGFVMQLIQAFMIRNLLQPTTTVADIIPAMLVAGVGLGMLSSQVVNLSLSSVPVADAGEASGVIQTFRQIGGALGIAVTGAIILTISASHFKQEIRVEARLTEADKAVVLAAADAEGGSLEFEPLRLPVGTSYAPVVTEVENRAIVEGNKAAFLLLLSLAALGFCSSTFLPKKRGS